MIDIGTTTLQLARLLAQSRADRGRAAPGRRRDGGRVKIALLGGGGFRVPMVFEALLERAGGLGLDEVTLYDVSEPRLAQITPVLEGLEQERGERLVFRPTNVLEDALDGADFVFCAIRPGQLEGRVVDERVPLDAGLVGQETMGPGGICMALRTVPVMVELAGAVAQLAPRAWFVNFTNPAGLVTEAIQEVLGGRAVGICDTPTSLCRRVAAALGKPQEELWFDYFGLNHLGWLRGVLDGDRDLLPDLLADDERLESFEEGRLFGGEWLRSLGMIPNEYLYFLYFASDTVDALRDGGASRGELLLDQQAVFYAGNGHSPQRRSTPGAPPAGSETERISPRRGPPPGCRPTPTAGRRPAATRRRRSPSCRRSPATRAAC